MRARSWSRSWHEEEFDAVWGGKEVESQRRRGGESAGGMLREGSIARVIPPMTRRTDDRRAEKRRGNIIGARVSIVAVIASLVVVAGAQAAGTVRAGERSVTACQTLSMGTSRTWLTVASAARPSKSGNVGRERRPDGVAGPRVKNRADPRTQRVGKSPVSKAGRHQPSPVMSGRDRPLSR